MKDLFDSNLVHTPRAIGRLSVSAAASGASSCLQDLYQNGCLKALFPTQQSNLEAVIINTAGGITGGDHLRIEAAAEADANITLTTQACERIYKAQPNSIGLLESQLRVAPGAALNWLPQETIFYNHGRLNRRLNINLAPDAKALIIESVLFGRQAMGETQIFGVFRDQIDLCIDGTLVYRDAALLNGDITAQLSRPAVAAGMGAMSTLLYRAPDAASMRSKILKLLNGTSGCSLIRDDLCAVRFMAADGFFLRQMILPILDILTKNTLPKCWRL